MTRILPMIAIAALLVLGGLWLSRRSVAEGAATPQTSQTSETIQAPAPPALPEGFVFTPYLSEAPVREFTEAEEVLEPGTDYGALIETSKGLLQLDLYEDAAPNTVNNFVFLARNRYYDGVVFHRVLEDFMAQTGDPTGTGSGGPGYQFDQEVAPDLSHDRRGVVSMANAGPNTNGSQFFITFGPTEWLDGSYNIFGQVVAGEEVLSDLTRIDPTTPSVVAPLEGTLQSLAEQGVALTGDPATSLEDHLSETLGALPSSGQTFAVEGYTGVLGSAGGERAVGFFPQPDRIERVFIIERATGG